jgi:hypothetical protein
MKVDTDLLVKFQNIIEFMELSFATHNPDKLVEIQAMRLILNYWGLEDVGLHEEIPETIATIAENAVLKTDYVRFHKSLTTPFLNWHGSYVKIVKRGDLEWSPLDMRDWIAIRTIIWIC